MDERRRVAEFVESNDLEAPPEFRLLDAVSELGEVAKDAAESSGYGADPWEIEIATDEIGDVLFSVLALADALDVDAGAALDDALGKYADRMDESGTPASGE